MSNAVWIILLVVTTYCAGCKRDPIKPSGCSNCITYSFKADIIPIFQQNCSTIGCHTSPNPAFNISLDSAVAYAAITHPGTGYVVAGNPNLSVMLSQLYTGVNPHMPIGYQLDACDIQKIYCWIQEGAPDN